MKKLKIGDLERVREKVRKNSTLRQGKARAKVTVHMGTCGIASGARKVMQTFMDEMAKRDVKDVILTTSGCAGLCSREPMATVELKDAAPVKYVDLDEEKSRKIFIEHVEGGKVVETCALAMGSETSY